MSPRSVAQGLRAAAPRSRSAAGRVKEEGMYRRRYYLSLALYATAAVLQPIALAATAIDWRSDLEFLRVEAPKAHVNLFHDLTPVAFNAAIDDLEKRSGGLAPRRQGTQ